MKGYGQRRRGIVGWASTPGRRWFQLADVVLAVAQARQERRDRERGRGR